MDTARAIVWSILKHASPRSCALPAIMSTKGMSVTAARELVDRTCAEYRLQLLAFLVDEGKRVELNALTSDQFIALLERKLAAHEITKVIPAPQDLEAAYCLFARGRKIQQDERVTAAIALDCGSAKSAVSSTT